MSERTYTALSAGYTRGFSEMYGARSTVNNVIAVCLLITYSDEAQDTTLETGYFRLGARDDTIPMFSDYTATARLNGLGQEDADKIGSAETALSIDFSRDREQIIPIIFPVIPHQPTEVFLTEGDALTVSRGDDLDWAMLIDLPDPAEANVEPSAEGPPRENVGNSSGGGTEPTQPAGNRSGSTVTAFNEPTVITVGLDKWRLTFDPAVEVRTFIGDYSIVPTRGQFLVIWFNQLSLSGEPLPLGNFTLQTSTGPGEPFGVRGLSREATAALIFTEYTWDGSYMSPDTEYRTGIVFDIAPQDTHFVLQYQGPAVTLGNPYVVDLKFDA